MFWIGYRFFIFLFEKALQLMAIWNSNASNFVKGRRHQDTKLDVWLGANDNPLIQIHSASLGEFELSLPLYENLSSKFPGHKFLFSFFSSSGYDHAKIPHGSEKAYLPIDKKTSVNSFLNLIQPSLVIFIKYEFWFEYLHQLQQKNIPYGYVNINQQSYPFNLRFKTAKHLVNQSSFIFSSNEKTSSDLKKHGIRVDKEYLDLRYTKSLQLLHENYKPSKSFQDFIAKDRVIICGSVWKEDLKIIRQVIKEDKHFKWIIAPHKINESSLTYFKDQLGSFSLFSSEKINVYDRVLLVDTIGDLKYLYRYGALNYVGGAFKTGLHNVLEPIAIGAPIVFGPNYINYPEATQLLKRGLGFSVSNQEEFGALIKKLEKGSLHLKSTEQLDEMKTGLVDMTDQIGKFI